MQIKLSPQEIAEIRRKNAEFMAGIDLSDELLASRPKVTPEQREYLRRITEQAFESLRLKGIKI